MAQWKIVKNSTSSSDSSFETRSRI